MSVVFGLKHDLEPGRVREILSAIEAAGLAPRPAFPATPPGRLASVYLVREGGEADLERVKGLIEAVAPGALEYIEVPPPRHRRA